LNTILSNSEDSFDISSKQLFYLKLFWGAFIVYSVSYVLTGNPHLSEKICQLLQLMAIVFIFFASIFLFKLKITNGYLRFIFIFYFLWLITILLRGIRFDFASVMYMLLNADYGILFYFVPFLIFFPQSLKFYKIVFDVIIILGILFFICDVLYLRELLDRSSETNDVVEEVTRTLAWPSGFILLTLKYHSNKRKIIALGVVALALLFSIYKARRGLSLTLGSLFVFAFFSYLFSTKQKLLIIYLSALFITIALLYANSIYNISNNKLLNLIAQRGEEDTRTGVELYFYNDMQTKDWVIGRGINGVYYCPGIDVDASDYRPVIETGYLQIILKGGIIRLILFLLIVIPAMVLGLFNSKNLLSKASAIWIFITLMSLYPATVESFSMQYILVWISVGICYSKKIRNLTNDYIVTSLHSELNFPS
jgi:hypothetical protein